jgi:hypothetical protein
MPSDVGRCRLCGTYRKSCLTQFAVHRSFATVPTFRLWARGNAFIYVTRKLYLSAHFVPEDGGRDSLRNTGDSPLPHSINPRKGHGSIKLDHPVFYSKLTLQLNSLSFIFVFSRYTYYTKLLVVI